MTRRRALGLGALVVAVVAVWLVVASTGSEEDDAPEDRPDRLLDLRSRDVAGVDVGGRALPDDVVDEVRDDLAPLLAIRMFDHVAPDYGLDPPSFVVTVHTAARTFEMRIGAYNFDRTAVYASVGQRVGTIIPRLAERLAAAVGITLG